MPRLHHRSPEVDEFNYDVINVFFSCSPDFLSHSGTKTISDIHLFREAIHRELPVQVEETRKLLLVIGECIWLD